KSSIVKDNEIKLSLDISRFASGRDGKTIDTLEGFLKYFNPNNEFTKENVASISDEEVLFSDLPKFSNCFCLDIAEGVILKKICLRMLGTKDIMRPIEVELADENSQNDKLEEKINEVNENKNHQVWKIVEVVKDSIKKSKMNQEDLKKLNVYSGKDDTIYNKLDKFITIKIGENI
ncbi:MAG: hypothetical protein PUC65_12540, partial [Clostridiales bacterium]|nr:hypothetical protein [Clostridiales bacterium]